MSFDREFSLDDRAMGSAARDNMGQVRFIEFPLDESIIAPTVYRKYERLGPTACEYVDQPNVVVPEGVALAPQVTRELGRLLADYSEFTGRQDMASRTDLMPVRDPRDGRTRLALIEIGRSFPDGWGTALNTSRAAGFDVDPMPAFPGQFILEDEAYRPELELLIAELGGDYGIVANGDETGGDPAFIYGYSDPELDNKRLLAEFARDWSGDSVIIPEFYTRDDTAWADIPEDVYLKFVNKQGPESARARFSVSRGKPEGKARFLRSCYEAGSLIAQREVEAVGMAGRPYVPYGEDGQNPRAQIILLSQRAPLTGYIQYSYNDVINDASDKGPLRLIPKG